MLSMYFNLICFRIVKDSFLCKVYRNVFYIVIFGLFYWVDFLNKRINVVIVIIMYINNDGGNVMMG